MILSSRGNNLNLPSVLYPQLLGLSMGMDGKTLGFSMNQLSIDGIEDFFFVPEPEEVEEAEAGEVEEEV
jgi:hypothetical protein